MPLETAFFQCLTSKNAFFRSNMEPNLGSKTTGNFTISHHEPRKPHGSPKMPLGSLQEASHTLPRDVLSLQNPPRTRLGASNTPLENIRKTPEGSSQPYGALWGGFYALKGLCCSHILVFHNNEIVPTHQELHTLDASTLCAQLLHENCYIKLKSAMAVQPQACWDIYIIMLNMRI